MAAPPPQLPYASPIYLGGYIPKQPRQPHLWQQALAKILGDVGGTAATRLTENAMAPSMHVDPATGEMSATSHGIGRSLTPQEQMMMAMYNARINQERGAGAASRAGAAHETAMTPVDVASGLARNKLTGAETDRLTAMTPAEVARIEAEAGNLGAKSDYTRELTNWVGPQAQALMGLQGAEQGKAEQEGGLIQAETGKTAAETGQIAPDAAARRALMAAQGAREQAGAGQAGAETGLINQEATQRMLSNYIMRNSSMFRDMFQKAQPGQAMPNQDMIDNMLKGYGGGNVNLSGAGL